MLPSISKSGLKKWAQKRFCEHYSTVELIASAVDESDKFNIAIVALLEVEPEIRYLGMRADEAQYIQSCHAYLNCLKNECGSGLTAPPGNVLSEISR